MASEPLVTAGDLPVPPVLNVWVALALRARAAVEVAVQLPAGSTLADAVRTSGLLADLPDNVVDQLNTGIWGRPAVPDQQLQSGDRVELCRALTVDPKMARRARFVRQGARGAGLFSHRRAGAKSGY